MTVAVLRDDYRQKDTQGRLDLEKTIHVLRDAESFMDAAAGVSCEKIAGETAGVSVRVFAGRTRRVFGLAGNRLPVSAWPAPRHASRRLAGPSLPSANAAARDGDENLAPDG